MNIDLTTKLVLQKFFALIVTLAAFVGVGSTYNFMLFAIVLGHSHFILAYIYKIAARKIKARNAVFFVCIALFLMYYFFRIDFPDFRIETLLLITTIYAIYHTVVDDQFTLVPYGTSFSLFQRLHLVMLVSALIGLHIWWQFESTIATYFIAVSFFFAVWFFISKLRTKQTFIISEYFFLAQWIITCIIYFSGVRFYFDRMLVLSFIGVYHYLLYYLHYYSRFSSFGKKNSRFLQKVPVYLTIIVISNIFFASLFFYNKSYPDKYLNVLFRYNPFMILTLMHFVSSTRLNEIPQILGFKKA